MSENVFDQSTDSDSPQNNENSEQTNPLDTWVGENKKYKSAEELSKAHTYQEQHIKTIEGELKEMREKESKAVKNEDVLKAIQEQSNNTSKEPTNPLSEDKIAEIVRDEVKGMSIREQATTNLKLANDKMVEKFGDTIKARKAVEDKATQMGVTFEDMVSLAEKSPALFEQSMGISNTTTQQVTAPHGSVNTAALPSTEGDQSKLYFDKIRQEDKKNGTRNYWSPEVQNAIQRSEANGTYFK